MSEFRNVSNKHPILVVEDSKEDFETTQRAFQKAHVSNPIVHCWDGDAALDYLFHRGRYQDASQSPRPLIILLDLNLPGTCGREVLNEIKSHDQLKTIPVIILTTSTDRRDIGQCYEMGANSYIQKPVNLPEFFDEIARLSHYWFEIVILPSEAACGATT